MEETRRLDRKSPGVEKADAAIAWQTTRATEDVRMVFSHRRNTDIDLAGTR